MSSTNSVLGVLLLTKDGAQAACQQRSAGVKAAGANPLQCGMKKPVWEAEEL